MNNIHVIMFKKLFFLLCFSLLNCVSVNAQWSIVKSPTRNNLNAVSFVSNTTGWIVGDCGTILYSDGNDWIENNKPTKENLYSIYMVERNNGWAVGAKGTILHFDGEEWQKVDSPTKSKLLSVYFKDTENGIAVGELGTILIYKEGIWSILDKEIRGNLHAAFFENDDTWIGGGLECVNVPIMKMAYNNGMTLIKKFDSFASINSIFFLNSYNGWAVGSPSILLHFNGFDWEEPTIDRQISSLNSVYFRDENNGISVGYNGTILIFSEGKWIKENSNITQNLKGATIVDKTYYAVGDSGTIIVKNKIDENIIVSQQLKGTIQVFPNPCNELINIIFPSESTNSTGLISIANIYGNVLIQKRLKLENENSPYTIITKDLKNGLYILTSIIGGKITSEKFVVQH